MHDFCVQETSCAGAESNAIAPLRGGALEPVTEAVWIVRTIGEKTYAALMLDLAGRSRLSHALPGIAASAFFVALAGGTIIGFYPRRKTPLAVRRNSPKYGLPNDNVGVIRLSHLAGAQTAGRVRPADSLPPAL